MSTKTKPNIMLNQPCIVASCCAWFSLRGNYMQACWRVVVVLNNVLQLLSIKCRSYFPAVVLEQTGIYWIHQSLYCGLNSRVSCRAQCCTAWPIKWINPDKTLPLRHQLPNEDRNQIAGQTSAFHNNTFIISSDDDDDYYFSVQDHRLYLVQSKTN